MSEIEELRYLLVGLGAWLVLLTIVFLMHCMWHRHTQMNLLSQVKPVEAPIPLDPASSITKYHTPLQSAFVDEDAQATALVARQHQLEREETAAAKAAAARDRTFAPEQRRVGSGASSSASSLPEGWKQATAPDGRTYYFAKGADGRTMTQWTPPAQWTPSVAPKATATATATANAFNGSRVAEQAGDAPTDANPPAADATPAFAEAPGVSAAPTATLAAPAAAPSTAQAASIAAAETPPAAAPAAGPPTGAPVEAAAPTRKRPPLRRNKAVAQSAESRGEPPQP